jgi:transposase
VTVIRPPIFVRSLLSDTEKERLQTALRSSVRLSSCAEPRSSSPENRGERASQIARSLGCGQQTVCDAIHDFDRRGLDALVAGSSRPKHTHRAFDDEQSEALFELLHQEDPRKFGKEDTFWTLQHYAAEASFERGITERQVGGETVRATLGRLGVRWERAKRWIESPDPEYARKKGLETGRSGSPKFILSGSWDLRTRPGSPALSDRVRTLLGRGGPTDASLLEKKAAKDDPEPKALACYGMYLPGIGETWLRFVDGRPVSAITTQSSSLGAARSSNGGARRRLCSLSLGQRKLS